ncbi:MAG TPA: diguanylate cyclase [Clostridium sp.]|nr:diguanylate cyclase [Clostridium sp.]
MSKIKNEKQNQINDIVSVVKLSTLLFVFILLTKRFYFIGDRIVFEYKKDHIFTYMFLPLVVFVLIYLLWTLFDNMENNKYKVFFDIIEISLFICIFTGTIIICGINETQCKVLFLFIIIVTTIQFGKKSGLVVAIISSIIVLGLDIILSPNITVNYNFQDDIVLAGVFILTALPLGHYTEIEKEYIKYLEDIANIDGLTQLYNHRYFYGVLNEKIKSGNKNKTPVSMIFIDIDNFKHYNDLYGHQKGDYVLKKVGKIINKNIRESDIAARYGGEEFAVILSNTSEEDALKIAERLRVKIEEEHFEGEENQPNGKITASFGVSVYPDKAKNDIELIKSADDALYRAKFFYKNRVEAYTSILDEIKSNIDEKDVELVTSVKTFISIINAKDKYTYGHVERVVMYSRMMADKLNLSEEDKKILIYGAYMHDIGKINISKDILVKKMKLDNEEWEILKQHPVDGVEIIKSVEALKVIIPLILYHHERYDGKGYPHNLKGKDIPYLARILTVVDSFDAMTSSRPYNKKKSYEEGLIEIRRCSGTQFDPEIAEKFIEVISENIKNNTLDIYQR